jgi:UPF0042 nucleotide-binding protein
VSRQRLVVITGLSGSGKSLAANSFEDLGFFCVDNLPVSLILPFWDLILRSREQIPLAALVIDARERGFLEHVPETLDALRRRGAPVELLFFDCADDALRRRFSETRRPHPMSRPGATLEQAIAAERAALARLRESADRIIDTSAYTPHQLRSFLRSAYGTSGEGDVLNLQIESFGFKYGVPAQADLVFDVRFLPNPHFVDELRRFDGRSPEVQRFLDGTPLTAEFLRRILDLLGFLIPQYRAEGKTYLTVALGCTGGKHRSVALAERIAAALGRPDVPCTVSHRDLGKE